MSGRELNRVEVLAKVDDGRLSVDNAANMLCLTRRQVFWLLKRYRQDGAAENRHKARGKPPNNRIHHAMRDYALSVIKEQYLDFGPTLAAEMLAEHHGFKVSRETVRKWMQEGGIWLSRKQRRTFHQPRLRREYYGELIKIDGSDHRWFEDRGDPCTLLVLIDDASSPNDNRVTFQFQIRPAAADIQCGHVASPIHDQGRRDGRTGERSPRGDVTLNPFASISSLRTRQRPSKPQIDLRPAQLIRAHPNTECLGNVIVRPRTRQTPQTQNQLRREKRLQTARAKTQIETCWNTLILKAVGQRRNHARLFSPAIFEVSGLLSLATVCADGDTSALQTR